MNPFTAAYNGTASLEFHLLDFLCRQPRHIHDHSFIHTLCQHLSGNLKASLVHAFLYAFLYAFLVAVINEGSFNAYGIPELVVGPEFGIRETGNLQFFCCRQILFLLYQFIFIE